jgi:uncharacterized protein YbjT (DUF2867 family)
LSIFIIATSRRLYNIIMSPKTFFICGVTGTQGGATARGLLARGASVHSVVRSPDSAAAQAIAAQGAVLTPGHFEDEAALRTAIAGTDAVFLNFMPDFADMEGNLRQAKLILRIAAEAGVKHAVYTSTMEYRGMEEREPWYKDSVFKLVLKSKQDIERAVQEAGLPYWTILRPCFFMSNFIQPFATYFGIVPSGRWTASYRSDSVIPMVDTETVGIVSATALLDPVAFDKRVITYADELLSVGYMFKRISEVTGRDVRLDPVSDDDIVAQREKNPLIGSQYIGREYGPQNIDMEQVKNLGLPLSSFEKFLVREEKQFLDTYKDVPAK